MVDLAEGIEDSVDRWIRMVATTRLTGHSPGFFSVYTLPPNQAVSSESQIKINEKRGQAPDYRAVRALILRKSVQLQRGLNSRECLRLRTAAADARFLVTDAESTPAIPAGCVTLTVTSPPFLDIVQYAKDNWLRFWFNQIDADEIVPSIAMSRTVEEWRAFVSRVFVELYRITRPGGCVAFEVAEVRKGRVRLEEHVVPVALTAGFSCDAVLINEQRFTKTANIWGVNNNLAGTNTNRIVVLRKGGATAQAERRTSKGYRSAVSEQLSLFDFEDEVRAE